MSEPFNPATHDYFASRFGPGGGGAHAGIGLTLISSENKTVRMGLNYRDELARSKGHPTLHAGAIVTGIDSAMGMSLMLFLEGAGGIATLDLRYDEFTPPPDRANVIVEARTERMDNNIAYLLGACLSEDLKTTYGKATARFIRTGDASPQFMQQLQQRQAQANKA